MNETDRNKIDLIQLGKMYGKVNSIDEKMDTFIAETGKFRETLQETLDKHDSRIRWNKNKLMWLIGLLIGSGVIGGAGWKFF